MAQILVYQVEFNGIKQAITDQKSLEDAIKKTTLARKEEAFTSNEYKRLTSQLGALKAIQGQVNQEQRNAQNEFKRTADAGKNSYRALNAELVRLRNLYKDLTEEERRNTFGEATLERIQQLDRELKSIDANLGNFQRNVGNYGSAFGEAFSQLSGFDIAALATIPGAVAAIGEVVVDVGTKVLDLVENIRKVRGEISVLNKDLDDSSLNDFTARVQALADTFGEDTTKIIESANNVAKAFDIDFGEALTRIEEGFVAGSNASGEFLDIAREYPKLFEEAGLSASQFFTVINRQVTQGFFSDKGADAVKEAAIRLRELTPATIAALQGIGITEKTIKDVIGEQGLAGAIALVSERLKTVRVDSQQAGAILADVFGGAGEDASVEFVRSLSDINDETKSLIDTTNEYQVAQLRSFEINREFNSAVVALSESLGGAGAKLDDVLTQIGTQLIKSLTEGIKYVKELGSSFEPLVLTIADFAKFVGIADEKSSAFASTLNVLKKAGEVVRLPFDILISVIKAVGGLLRESTRNFESFFNTLARPFERLFGKDSPNLKGFKTFTDLANSGKKEVFQFGKEAEETGKKAETAAGKVGKLTKSVVDLADKAAKGSLAALRKEVADIESKIDQAAPEDKPGLIERLFGAKGKLQEAEKQQKDLIARLRNSVEEVQKVASLNDKEFTRTQVGIERGVITNITSTEKGIRVVGTSLVERLSKLGVTISDASLKFTKEASERIRTDTEAAFDAAFEELGEFFKSGEFFAVFDEVAGNISSLASARNESELKMIEAKYEREIELAEGNEKKKMKLEKELQKERERIAKEEFEQQKRYRKASAIASLASGIVNVLTNPSTLPDPFAAIFDAARIGFLVFTTQQQIAAIDAQQAAKGMFLSGESHAEGGIPLMINGVPVEAEHGEFITETENGGVAIINKKSSSIFKDVLSDIGVRNFPGKKRMLSEINSFNGYGVKFESGGTIEPNFSRMNFGVGASGASIVVLDPDSVTAIKEAVNQGSSSGVVAGLVTANRENEREELANQNSKL